VPNLAAMHQTMSEFG